MYMKYRELLLNHKIIAILLSLLGLIVCVGIWLHFPILQNAGSSKGYNCSRMHIYLPRRLDFKGCHTVTGIIKKFKIEPDGDSHALLMLDDKYKDMLTQQNYQKQHGYLVIEDTCHAKPKDILIHLVCLNYLSRLPNPEVGKRYEITGNYAIDDWHGSWAEIHGVSELKQLD